MFCEREVQIQKILALFININEFHLKMIKLMLTGIPPSPDVRLRDLALRSRAGAWIVDTTYQDVKRYVCPGKVPPPPPPPMPASFAKARGGGTLRRLQGHLQGSIQGSILVSVSQPMLVCAELPGYPRSP